MVLPLLVPIANNDETLFGEIDYIDIVLTITNVLFKKQSQDKVSISSTFYARVFRTNVVFISTCN